MTSFEKDNVCPLVSVLMPAFNAAAYISKSINSVIDQTYANWELIIVDDGSKDDTLDIIRSWQLKDSRIKLLINDKNLGLGLATNKALQNARGKFIAKLDSDDWVSNDWLSSRLEHFSKKPKLIAVSGSRFFINENGEITRKLCETFLPITVSWRLVYGNPVIHPGVLFVANEEMQYPDFRYLEDWDLWSRLIFKGDIEVVNDHKVYYRIHQSNTSSLPKSKEELLPIIESIVLRQLSRFSNIKPDSEIIWYLYRDRTPFEGNKNTIKEALIVLSQLFEAFLNFFEVTDKKALRELRISLWDEIFHIMRLGKADKPLLIELFKKFPLSLKDITYNSYNWHVARKGIFLCSKNSILR